MKNSDKDGRKPSASLAAGAVALVFLIIGYQSAVLVHKASVAKIIANHDSPDTVYVAELPSPSTEGQQTGSTNDQQYKSQNHNQYGTTNNNQYKTQNDHQYWTTDNHQNQTKNNRPYKTTNDNQTGSTTNHQHGTTTTNRQYTTNHQHGTTTTNRQYTTNYQHGTTTTNHQHGTAAGAAGTVRKESDHSPESQEIRRAYTPRRYESFPFDPNTATVDDLMRLGFSAKQAASIDNYRKKGGRFRRKSDFAKSYVVEDSVYRRLEPFLEIPLLDINTADSAAFETLPGIGKYFAAKMVSHREELQGYSFPEQLLEIWHFDKEKLDGLSDLITVGTKAYPPYPLWSLSEEELSRHPYIDAHAAHSIVLFRDNTPRKDWSVEKLVEAGILGKEKGSLLARCRIAAP